MSFLPLRLKPKADLRRALEEASLREGHGCAFVVTGIGSLDGATLRLAGAESASQMAGMFEIVSLSGTLGPDCAHLHMTVADANGRVTGGHVCYGNEVRTTAEVLLACLPEGRLGRELDPATGFEELVVFPQAGDAEDRAMPTPPLRSIDHIHVFVTDRIAAEAWYARVLGLSRVAELERWAADGGPLTLADASGRIHLALFERGAQACRSTVALGVSAAELLAWQEHLASTLGSPVPLEDHQLSWSLYFADPDGNPYEITTYDHDTVARLRQGAVPGRPATG